MNKKIENLLENYIFPILVFVLITFILTYNNLTLEKDNQVKFEKIKAAINDKLNDEKNEFIIHMPSNKEELKKIIIEINNKKSKRITNRDFIDLKERLKELYLNEIQKEHKLKKQNAEKEYNQILM